MPAHLVVGAGPIGSAVARLLAEQGETVRIVTRSGSGPDHPRIDRVAADASDGRRLTDLAAGAEVVYNCVNPPYTQWEKLWFPLNNAMITAAKAAGAVYAITGNLYGYGPQPDGRMTEDTPLAAVGRKGKVRNQMWRDALDSGVRTLEVRGSDYLGAGALGVFSYALLPAITKGRTAWLPGDPELPHSFTYTGDMARTLVLLARDDRAYGKGWHVPTPAATSIRDLADRYCALVGAPRLELRKIPRFVGRTAGVVVPMAREMAEMDYQFYRPFHLDSTLTERTFGIAPTDLDAVLREVADSAAPKPTVARR